MHTLQRHLKQRWDRVQYRQKRRQVFTEAVVRLNEAKEISPVYVSYLLDEIKELVIDTTYKPFKEKAQIAVQKYDEMNVESPESIRIKEILSQYKGKRIPLNVQRKINTLAQQADERHEAIEDELISLEDLAGLAEEIDKEFDVFKADNMPEAFESNIYDLEDVDNYFEILSNYIEEIRSSISNILPNLEEFEEKYAQMFGEE
jgi:hypothetical protein